MRRTSIALATFLFSAALSAQNVIPNPDLTTGIAGWSLLQVTGTGWSQTEGDPDPGSLEITNVGGFGGYSWGRTCVAVSELTQYAFSYNLKKDGSSVQYPILISWIDWYELRTALVQSRSMRSMSGCPSPAFPLMSGRRTSAGRLHPWPERSRQWWSWAWITPPPGLRPCTSTMSCSQAMRRCSSMVSRPATLRSGARAFPKGRPRRRGSLDKRNAECRLRLDRPVYSIT